MDTIRPGRGRLALHEQGRIRAAAQQAMRSYPGPIGELVARELRAHADFGYRFASDSLLPRLAAEILRAGGDQARARPATSTATTASATGDPEPGHVGHRTRVDEGREQRSGQREDDGGEDRVGDLQRGAVRALLGRSRELQGEHRERGVDQAHPQACRGPAEHGDRHRHGGQDGHGRHGDARQR